MRQAEEAYCRYLEADISVRETILPTSSIPPAWKQVDSWLRPKVLSVIPQEIQEWVTSRAKQGYVDDTQVVLFHLLKRVAPGNAEERVHLTQSILKPKCCSKPAAAQKEVI